MFQVTARWDPAEACRPIIDEAPVFYPTVEVFFHQNVEISWCSIYLVLVFYLFDESIFPQLPFSHFVHALFRNLRIHLVTYQRYVQKQSHLVYAELSLHLHGGHHALLRRKIYGNVLNFPHEFSKLTCFKTGSP